ncbi:MAG: PKD domain-containing protein [Desulfobacteraceae bacterium]
MICFVDFRGLVGWKKPEYTCSWDFGDGNSATDRDPSHTYTAEGTFCVALTVTDADGNVATATKNISVTPPPGYYTFTVNSINGNVTLNPNQATYSEGETVTLQQFQMPVMSSPAGQGMPPAPA